MKLTPGIGGGRTGAAANRPARHLRATPGRRLPAQRNSLWAGGPPRSDQTWTGRRV
ncbi:hypothetical protein FMEAI12_1670019 [Parafrankia sp. Ea1.12]|nr:hypothetical protein FMEAI12_1670019 [Parafrankia sp. Ea1.12]